MKLQSPHLTAYLKASPVIACDHPAIVAKADALVDEFEDDVVKARTLFEWVRDEIPHSWDVRARVGGNYLRRYFCRTDSGSSRRTDGL